MWVSFRCFVSNVNSLSLALKREWWFQMGLKMLMGTGAHLIAPVAGTLVILASQSLPSPLPQGPQCISFSCCGSYGHLWTHLFFALLSPFWCSARMSSATFEKHFLFSTWGTCHFLDGFLSLGPVMGVFIGMSKVYRQLACTDMSEPVANVLTYKQTASGLSLGSLGKPWCFVYSVPPLRFKPWNFLQWGFCDLVLVQWFPHWWMVLIPVICSLWALCMVIEDV